MLSTTNFKRLGPFTVTTDSNGDATAYIPPNRGNGQPGRLRARIIAVIYEKVDYAAGVDIAITTEESEITVWDEDDVNSSKTVFPTVLVQDQVGADTTQRDYIPIADERLVVVIDEGGDTKSGRFTLVYEG